MSVVPFPSTASDDHLALQLLETMKREAIATDLAIHLFGEPMFQLDRRTASLCRYLATHALRSSQECWIKAAQRRAFDAAKEAMRTEGGKAFRDLPEAHIEALAKLLSARVLTAYHGITEGSIALMPGSYLDIVRGAK